MHDQSLLHDCYFPLSFRSSRSAEAWELFVSMSVYIFCIFFCVISPYLFTFILQYIPWIIIGRFFIVLLLLNFLPLVSFLFLLFFLFFLLQDTTSSVSMYLLWVGFISILCLCIIFSFLLYVPLFLCNYYIFLFMFTFYMFLLSLHYTPFRFYIRLATEDWSYIKASIHWRLKRKVTRVSQNQL